MSFYSWLMERGEYPYRSRPDDALAVPCPHVTSAPVYDFEPLRASETGFAGSAPAGGPDPVVFGPKYARDGSFITRPMRYCACGCGRAETEGPLCWFCDTPQSMKEVVR